MSIQSIIRWFEIAKPEPTLKDVAMQVGVHFEEVAEMMEATNNDSTETYQAPNLTPYLKPLNPDPDNSYGGSHD